jgi:hypothetical protein
MTDRYTTTQDCAIPEYLLLHSKISICKIKMLSSSAQRVLARRVASQARTSRLFEERSATFGIRQWSSKQKDDDEEPAKAEESLKDTVRKMQQGDKAKTSDDNMDAQFDGFLRSAAGTWSSFSEEVGKTWDELLKSGERKSINKKLNHPEDTMEGEAEYTGTVDIMVIDESEHLTAWERMQKRLTDAPIISGKNRQEKR